MFDSNHVAMRNEILRGIVGSTSHGTAIENQDDRDEMGVFVEPPEYVCGLHPLEHYIYRDQPNVDGRCMPSKPGDLDLVMYSLRKFCRLAEKGNPSVIILMWLPQHLVKTALGVDLIWIREAFISRNCAARFLGYLIAQRQKMKGERANTTKRPELIEKYGYDVKFAMHALRLGFEGIELLKHRYLTLPVAEPTLSLLRGVRTGQYTFTQWLAMIDDTEKQLRELLQQCTWTTDQKRINDFMVRAHIEHWQDHH
jgi:predicted nucleotidyltransferase